MSLRRLEGFSCREVRVSPSKRVLGCAIKAGVVPSRSYSVVKAVLCRQGRVGFYMAGGAARSVRLGAVRCQREVGFAGRRSSRGRSVGGTVSYQFLSGALSSGGAGGDAPCAARFAQGAGGAGDDELYANAGGCGRWAGATLEAR